MSAIPFESLKGSTDLSLPFITRSEIIGVNPINHDTLLEFGFIVKTLRIVNNDSSGSIFYRTGASDAVLKEVPPNSDDTIEGWFAIFLITPNSITGNGLLEYDLTRTSEALKDEFK